METALRYELIQAIPELNNQMYPTNAPETASKPYLVYTRITTKKIKNLSGYTNKENISYMFSVMATRYEDMKFLRDKVESLLISMYKTNIGKSKNVFIEDLTINNIEEQYEHELRVYRGIIDFTIFK